MRAYLVADRSIRSIVGGHTRRIGCAHRAECHAHVPGRNRDAAIGGATEKGGMGWVDYLYMGLLTVGISYCFYNGAPLWVILPLCVLSMQYFKGSIGHHTTKNPPPTGTSKNLSRHTRKHQNPQ